MALVTVGTMVGYGGFGSIILNGFNNNFYGRRSWPAPVGCLALALVFDLVLVGLGRLAMPWARRRAAA